MRIEGVNPNTWDLIKEQHPDVEKEVIRIIHDRAKCKRSEPLSPKIWGITHKWGARARRASKWIKRKWRRTFSGPQPTWDPQKQRWAVKSKL